jgi:hypothetical protein
MSRTGGELVIAWHRTKSGRRTWCTMRRQHRNETECSDDKILWGKRAHRRWGHQPRCAPLRPENMRRWYPRRRRWNPGHATWNQREENGGRTKHLPWQSDSERERWNWAKLNKNRELDPRLTQTWGWGRDRLQEQVDLRTPLWKWELETKNSDLDSTNESERGEATVGKTNDTDTTKRIKP